MGLEFGSSEPLQIKLDTVVRVWNSSALMRWVEETEKSLGTCKPPSQTYPVNKRHMVGDVDIHQRLSSILYP